MYIQAIDKIKQALSSSKSFELHLTKQHVALKQNLKDSKIEIIINKQRSKIMYLQTQNKPTFQKSTS